VNWIQPLQIFAEVTEQTGWDAGGRKNVHDPARLRSVPRAVTANHLILIRESFMPGRSLSLYLQTPFRKFRPQRLLCKLRKVAELFRQGLKFALTHLRVQLPAPV
jgi:hypothetical protein